MPQITCPNCGTTISLENRKEIDFNMITKAAEKRPRTFTELLHITKLSRKTLSLRLKELCVNGILVKTNGVYESNGFSETGKRWVNSSEKFSKVFHDKRMRTGIILIGLLACFPVATHVLAIFFAPQVNQQPVIIGSFEVALEVHNVEDLYTWQASIAYNSSELKVLETSSGEFFNVDYPLFVSETDVGADMLCLGGTLCGSVPGVNGSGRLATIVFGYFTEGYEPPRLVMKEKWFETFLLNSNRFPIPIGDPTTLTLTYFND